MPRKDEHPADGADVDGPGQSGNLDDRTMLAGGGQVRHKPLAITGRDACCGQSPILAIVKRASRSCHDGEGPLRISVTLNLKFRDLRSRSGTPPPRNADPISPQAVGGPLPPTWDRSRNRLAPFDQ